MSVVNTPIRRSARQKRPTHIQQTNSEANQGRAVPGKVSNAQKVIREETLVLNPYPYVETISAEPVSGEANQNEAVGDHEHTVPVNIFPLNRYTVNLIYLF